MPDQFDDLWVKLRLDAERWVDGKAPSKFDSDQLDKAFDTLPAMTRFEERVKGMDRDSLAHAYVNHVRRDAKTRVGQNLRDRGTRVVRSFYRAELNQPSLFSVDGLFTQPVIYTLDDDALVPLKYLSVSEATRREELVLKKQSTDLEALTANLRRVLEILDSGEEEDGTFLEAGPSIYRHLVSNG